MRTDSNSMLFLREVSERKLRKLVEQAYKDPSLLMKATEEGFFNTIRPKARDILKIEKGNAKTNTVRSCFQKAIKILDDKV